MRYLLVIAILLTLLVIAGCDKPAQQIDDSGFKECIIYKGMVDGRIIIASPNCHLTSR